jgi:outer membrane protein
MIDPRALVAGTVCCALACLAGQPATGADQALGLREAVEQTLASSLDLAAQRAQLDADREAIGISRSTLLPQIDLGAQGQILDDDRADGARGRVTEKSATLVAGLTQVVYDEGAWAGYSIQKHVFESQEGQFETYRLGVIADAATTFLALEQAEAVAAIQRQNREITRRNIETARARVATGYSGERDVLRWQSQLSANDTAVVQALTQSIISRFELNRVRDRPSEESIVVSKTRLEEQGFAFGRPSLSSALVDEKGARIVRDFMVRVGVARSPVLAAIDAAVEAENRQVTASSRAFWVPSVSLGAGVNYLAAKQSASGQSSSTNATEWGVKAGLTFPLLEGGAKISELRQSRLTLSSLRTQRRSERQSIEESIRAAFARVSGSFASLGFAKAQVESSKRNFELVDQSYVAGVSSILDLLDAQTQLLEAQIGAANAYYGFFEDLIAAEQALAMFAFLEPKSEMSALLDQLEAELQRRM